MYQKERIDTIMNILKENGYVTVKYLTRALDYSNATINRDLNIMEKQKLITRTYGGVEMRENLSVPLEFRYHKERIQKRKISKCAADFICEGDTVLIDASTTTEKRGDFVTDMKDITVITNNMALAAHLSENISHVICTGGRVIEAPYMLGGDAAIRTILRYNFDKAFFSTGGAGSDGIVKSRNAAAGLFFEAIRKNTKKLFFLTDHSKIDVDLEYNIADFSEIDAVISDYHFPEEVKKRYNNVEFCEV